MLLTLELVVFSFTVATFFITALVRGIDKLNTIQSSISRVETKLEFLEEHQAQQGNDIADLRKELNR